MSATARILDEVRGQLAPSDESLEEAKKRRDLVLDAAFAFPGARRRFRSGSLAHGTANCPVHRRDVGLDADGGVVLDRRAYWHLGPDGSGVGPDDIVEEVLDEVLPKFKAEYPNATAKITKRAILIEPHHPLSTVEDPSIDLIVALDRRDKPGLWIPNTQAHRWDPSHPEKHTDLLTTEPKSLRVTRAHAIRLAKGENKATDRPPLCSFNLEAFGLMFVVPGMGDALALLSLWEDGAADLQERLTPDPAHVSPPIKVEDRSWALERLLRAARHLRSALEHDDDLSWVRDELRQLWPDFVASEAGRSSKAQLLAALNTGATVHVTNDAGLSTSSGAPLKRTWAYGDAEA